MSSDIDFASTVLSGPVQFGYDIRENYLKPKYEKAGCKRSVSARRTLSYIVATTVFVEKKSPGLRFFCCSPDFNVFLDEKKRGKTKGNTSEKQITQTIPVDPFTPRMVARCWFLLRLLSRRSARGPRGRPMGKGLGCTSPSR